MQTENSKPMFFFYQPISESSWKVAPASEREEIIREYRPPFVTVLDVSSDFAHELTKEENDALKYSGIGFYADFDGDDEDFGTVIAQFKRFLGNLQGYGLNLAQCHLAATGGRGFHVEIPLACFMPKVKPEGIEHLPLIFKEMAHELYVDTLDLRVYSQKKGRMWRVPGIQRGNGLYKVPLTPAEALAMTPELYAELCSTPRYLVRPDAPTFNPGLAALYAAAWSKVNLLCSRKRTTGKVSEAMRKRFAPRGAALPPSLLGLASGQIPARIGAGFNQICIQLCITAHAMGTSEDDLVALCAGLIEKHQGDGARYGTPRKREYALRETYGYIEGSGYDVSIGGIKSILPRGERCNDLKGL